MGILYSLDAAGIEFEGNGLRRDINVESAKMLIIIPETKRAVPNKNCGEDSQLEG